MKDVEAKSVSDLNEAIETAIKRRTTPALEIDLEEPLPNRARFEQCIELSLRFLSKPWDIYKNGNHVVRQTVLRLAFSEPLIFTPEGVYGTPKTALPFKVLGGFSTKKCEMVLLERIELSTSPLPRECSTSELQQRRGGGVALMRPPCKPRLDGFSPMRYGAGHGEETGGTGQRRKSRGSAQGGAQGQSRPAQGAGTGPEGPQYGHPRRG